MIRQNHRLTGHEFEQTPGDSGGQRSLARCSPWGLRAGQHSDWTTLTLGERLTFVFPLQIIDIKFNEIKLFVQCFTATAGKARIQIMFSLITQVELLTIWFMEQLRLHMNTIKSQLLKEF